jgi:hypothetical protein
MEEEINFEETKIDEELNCENDWIECICILTFDLTLGQSKFLIFLIKEMEKIYPKKYNKILEEKQILDL